MSSRIPKYKKKALTEIKTICRIHQNKFDMQAFQLKYPLKADLTE